MYQSTNLFMDSSKTFLLIGLNHECLQCFSHSSTLNIFILDIYSSSLFRCLRILLDFFTAGYIVLYITNPRVPVLTTYLYNQLLYFIPIFLILSVPYTYSCIPKARKLLHVHCFLDSHLNSWFQIFNSFFSQPFLRFPKAEQPFFEVLILVFKKKTKNYCILL